MINRAELRDRLRERVRLSAEREAPRRSAKPSRPREPLDGWREVAALPTWVWGEGSALWLPDGSRWEVLPGERVDASGCVRARCGREIDTVNTALAVLDLEDCATAWAAYEALGRYMVRAALSGAGGRLRLRVCGRGGDGRLRVVVVDGGPCEGLGALAVRTVREIARLGISWGADG